MKNFWGNLKKNLKVAQKIKIKIKKRAGGGCHLMLNAIIL